MSLPSAVRIQAILPGHRPHRPHDSRAIVFACALVLVLPLALPALPAGTASTGAAAATDRLADAKARRESGDYAGALEIYRSALSAARGSGGAEPPDSAATAEINAQMGSLLVATGDWAGAETALAEARRADSTNTRALAEMSVLFLQESRFAEAAPLLERLRPLVPDDADLDYELGWARAAAGHADRAAGALHDALAGARPCIPSVVGEPRKQEALLQRRGYFPPDDGDSFVSRSDILALLGRVMVERGDRAHALEFLRKASAEAPARPDILADFGRVLLLEGKPDTAATMLGRAASIDTKDPLLWNDAGVAYALAGDRKKAVECISEATHLPAPRLRPEMGDAFTRNRDLAREMERGKGGESPKDPGFTLVDSLRVKDDPRFTPQVAGHVSRWQPVKVESPPTLNYPYDALARRLEGTVLLRVTVDVRGQAGAVTVVCADPPLTEGMVAEAIRSVREARYRPAYADGSARESRILLPIAFRLDTAR